MLTEICQYLRNWFTRDILVGAFAISGGKVVDADGIALPILEGQYFRIVGSVFNDGVHQNTTKDTLVDEPGFNGAVWLMAIPPAFLALVSEIDGWVKANESAINSPYTSESFGGYSYSLRGSNGSESASGAVTWQNQFKARLNPWRKI